MINPTPPNPTDPISSFTFEGEYVVRSFLDDKGEPWFVSTDVCRTLGISDAKQAVERLDADERGRYGIPSGGGIQQTVVINESGLYSLILTSRKPEAKRFKKWITSEVLPAIRKTGVYSSPNLSPAELILAQAQRLVDHERQLANHDKRIGSLEAKVNAHDEWIEHFTIVGYCNLRKLRAPTPDQALTWGKRAAALSRERKIPMGNAADTRYGKVNTYHISILMEVIGPGEIG